MPASRSKVPAHVALIVGAVLVVIAFLLAELVSFPSTGHRIDTAKWPVEAQDILREKPGVPVTPEQWKRIDKVLLQHGGLNHGQQPNWAQTVRASWWWFVALPVVASLLLSAKHRTLALRPTMLVVLPSAAVLLVAVALSGLPP
jgi:hypothetical protein